MNRRQVESFASLFSKEMLSSEKMTVVMKKGKQTIPKEKKKEIYFSNNHDIQSSS
jgi:hypothetical protein